LPLEYHDNSMRQPRGLFQRQVIDHDPIRRTAIQPELLAANPHFNFAAAR